MTKIEHFVFNLCGCANRRFAIPNSLNSLPHLASRHRDVSIADRQLHSSNIIAIFATWKTRVMSNARLG